MTYIIKDHNQKFGLTENRLCFAMPTLMPWSRYSLWPGEMSASTPALLAIGARTVAAMGALGSWQQGNAFPEMVPAAVRAGVRPEWILGNISARVNATMAQSGVMAEGAETQGATQGINDMLCASWDGVIRLFSPWPLGQPAAFTQLRAKGGLQSISPVVRHPNSLLHNLTMHW